MMLNYERSLRPLHRPGEPADLVRRTPINHTTTTPPTTQSHTLLSQRDHFVLARAVHTGACQGIPRMQTSLQLLTQGRQHLIELLKIDGQHKVGSYVLYNGQFSAKIPTWSAIPFWIGTRTHNFRKMQ